ncbi:MAG: Calx-beta domain-containing protein, partial [Planctomycetota bacterium]
AFWHHPPYSKGSHDSDVSGTQTDMREEALPLLEDGGVDIVLCGHSHAYERSFLLDGHYGLSTSLTSDMILDPGDGKTDGDGAYQKQSVGPNPHEGTIHIVAGSSGRISSGPLDHPVMVTSLLELGSVVLDVDGGRLDARFIDATGNVDDYFTMFKGSLQADFSGFPLSGNGPLTVNFTDLSAGTITAYSWDFGDGGTSVDQNPSHTYDSAGVYTVSLTLTGPGGNNTETKTDYITVGAALTIDDVIVDEGAGTMNFTVSLSAPGAQAINVGYATRDSTAAEPDDYTATSGTLTIPAPSTTGTITVPVIDDASVESSEVFIMDLSVPVNATLADSQGVATITDNDGLPSLTIDDVTVDEGASTINFTVSLSVVSAQAINVGYATRDSTAAEPDDYTAASGTLTIPADSTTGTIAVPVIDDALNETTEVFIVHLSSPVNATLADSQGVGTITDDDGRLINVPADYVTIQAAFDAAAEGDTISVAPGIYPEAILLAGKSVVLASWFLTTGDTSYISQTVLDGSGGTSVITIENSVGTATSIIGLTIQNAVDGIFPHAIFDILNCRIINTNDGIDYESGSGGLCKFNIFENNNDDGIDLDGDIDIIIEDNIIRNNGDDGIEIRLEPYNGPVLNCIIRNNEIYGNDEDGIQLIDYDTVSDRFFLIERNVIYNNVMAGLGCMGGTNTKENYEGASIPERIYLFNNTFVANDYGVTGGDSLVAVNNIFVDHTGTAMKNVDGGSIVSYNIYWNNGTDFENCNVDNPNILLSDPLLGTQFHLQPASPAIDAGTAFFTWHQQTVLDLPSVSYNGIAPDLGAFEFVGVSVPSLSINDVTVTEGDSDTVDVNFNVTLSSAGVDTVTVEYATSDGTATAPGDYMAVPVMTLTFAPGETSQPVSVTVIGDVLDEPDETFFVDLNNPVNAIVADSQGVGTISDDDGLPSLSIGDVTVVEGAGTILFTVSLSAVSSEAVNVDFATSDSTAMAPGDYTAASGTLTIPADSVSGTIAVPIIDDALIESSEVFTMDLSN